MGGSSWITNQVFALGLLWIPGPCSVLTHTIHMLLIGLIVRDFGWPRHSYGFITIKKYPKNRIKNFPELYCSYFLSSWYFCSSEQGSASHLKVRKRGGGSGCKILTQGPISINMVTFNRSYRNWSSHRSLGLAKIQELYFNCYLCQQ